MQEIGRRLGMRKRMGKRKKEGGGRGRIYNWENIGRMRRKMGNGGILGIVKKRNK